MIHTVRFDRKSLLKAFLAGNLTMKIISEEVTYKWKFGK